MYQYPYGNAQQLNLDWILSKLQELDSGSGGGADLEEVANTLVSASFDATIPYRKYDYAFYDGELYRALNDTIGAFNPADWMEVTLGADIPVLTRLVNADSALITTLQNQLQNLGSDEVANESTVTGTTVSDALGNLNGAINDTAQSLAPKTTSPSTISIPDKTLFFLGNVLKHAKTQISVGETINSGNSVDFTLNNLVRVIPFQASIYDLDTLKTTLGTAYCFEIASQFAIYVGYFENVTLPTISTMLQIRTLPTGSFSGSTPRLIKGWVYYHDMTGYDANNFVETQPNTSMYIYPRSNITFSQEQTNMRFVFIQFAFLPSGNL